MGLHRQLPLTLRFTQSHLKLTTMTYEELKIRYIKLQKLIANLRHNEIMLMKHGFSSEYKEKVKYYRRQIDKHLRNDRNFNPNKPEMF